VNLSVSEISGFVNYNIKTCLTVKQKRSVWIAFAFYAFAGICMQSLYLFYLH
jgi:hypothetical protein